MHSVKENEVCEVTLSGYGCKDSCCHWWLNHMSAVQLLSSVWWRYYDQWAITYVKRTNETWVTSTLSVGCGVWSLAQLYPSIPPYCYFVTRRSIRGTSSLVSFRFCRTSSIILSSLSVIRYSVSECLGTPGLPEMMTSISYWLGTPGLCE